MVNGICSHFIENFHCILDGFGDVGEYIVHLRLRFQPFLLSITHAHRVVDSLVCAYAYQTVMCVGIIFVYEMNIVGCDNFDVKFASNTYKFGVYFLLSFKYFCVCTG